MKTYLLILLSFLPFISFAENILGGEISYEYISGNTYKIKLSMWADCSSTGNVFQNLINGSPKILIYDNNVFEKNKYLALNNSPGIDISQICADSLNATTCTSINNNIQGINPFYYEDTIDLGRKSSKWRFIFQGDYITGKAYRSTNINSLQNSSCPTGAILQSRFMLEASLNNMQYDNSSAIGVTDPSIFIGKNQLQDFNSMILDTIDQDALNFIFMQPLDGYSTNVNSPCLVPYVSGFSATNPVHTSAGFIHNIETGQMKFTPTTLEKGTIVQQVEERRNGILVGTMMRENTFMVVNDTMKLDGYLDSTIFQFSPTGITITMCINNLWNFFFFKIKNDTNSTAQIYNTPFTSYNINYVPSDSFLSALIYYPTNLDSGYVFITLTNTHCPHKMKKTFEIKYNIKPIPVINNVTVTTTNCSPNCSGTITVDAIINGGGSLLYQIDTVTQSSNVFTNLCIGSYNLSVRDSSSCAAFYNVHIESSNPVFPVINYSPIVSCTPGCDGKVIFQGFSPSGNYTYRYNGIIYNVGDTLNNLCTGWGQGLEVIDQAGCVRSIQYYSLLLGPPYPILNSYTATKSSCNVCDGAITTINTSNTNCTYSIDGVNYATSGLFTGLCAGMHTIYMKGSNGCIGYGYIEIKSEAPTFNNVIAEPTSCGQNNNDGAISFTISSNNQPVMYSINGGSYQMWTQYDNLSNGIYIITAKDANGCTSSTLVAITSSVNPFVENLVVNDVTCFQKNNGKIELSMFGYGSKTYSITPGTQTNNDGVFTNLSPGTYIIEMKDSKNCQGFAQAEILEPNQLVLIDSLMTNKTCNTTQNGQINITAIGGKPPLLYTDKSTGLDNMDGEFLKLASGYHTIQIKDVNDCIVEKIFNIGQYEKPLKIDVKKTMAGCSLNDKNGIEVTATDGFPPYQYYWNGLSNNATAKYDIEPGMYVIKVKDEKQCEEIIYVNLEPNKNCCEVIFIPNSFSPNNDGKNDEFKFIGNKNLAIEEMNIFNRWGENIFYTNSTEFGWDGHQKGEPADMGTYFYLIKYRCFTNNKVYIKKGDLILMR